MGRCIHVEPLALHNLKVFEDHIQILYDSNKMDQTGDKCQCPNRIYEEYSKIVRRFTGFSRKNKKVSRKKVQRFSREKTLK